jgi:hypothetical protein
VEHAGEDDRVVAEARVVVAGDDELAGVFQRRGEEAAGLQALARGVVRHGGGRASAGLTDAWDGHGGLLLW